MNTKLHNKNIKKIEIIFEDCLQEGFDFNINKKKFIYEVIAIWKNIIKPYSKYKEWIEIFDDINNLTQIAS